MAPQFGKVYSHMVDSRMTSVFDNYVCDTGLAGINQGLALNSSYSTLRNASSAKGSCLTIHTWHQGTFTTAKCL